MAIMSPRKLMQKFKEYKGLLYCVSAAFAVNWKCETEEPYSLALVLFADACHRYDGSIPFGKWVASYVRKGLLIEQRERFRENRKVRFFEELNSHPERKSEFELKQFVESLSEDGRAIVGIALDVCQPEQGGVGDNARLGKLYKGGKLRRTGGSRPRVQPPVTRAELETIMNRRRGWGRLRTRAAISEVEAAL